MWSSLLVTVLAVAEVTAERSSQKPLGVERPAEAPPGLSSPQWSLNFSSAAPYLFSSVSSLLQQWGNTFFPNGHAIVPCEIPPFTLFFHGRTDSELPPSPEWLAFDIEMSYGIMGSTRNSHMLTYQTTKPVKVLYFDGESAALMGLGQLDTQMLHIYGNTSGPPHDRWGLFDEYGRASGLCDWLEEAGLRGDGWGYEGIIRMNAGFELIWCSFTSPSLKLLTHLNVTAPQLPKGKEMAVRGAGAPIAQEEQKSYYSLPADPTRTDRSTDPTDPPRPPNWRRDVDREPFLRAQGWGWFASATYHYGSSRNGPGLGEVRAKVNSCGLLSYYSPRFTNLTLSRAESERDVYNITGQGFWKGEGAAGNRTTALTQLRRRRRYHHLEDVTRHEAAMMRNSSEKSLSSILAGGDDCSGADWIYIANEIAQNTATHLKRMEHALDLFSDSSHNKSSIKDWFSTLRSESHMFHVGYLEYPAQIDSSAWKTSSRLFEDTYSRCRYRYTRLMAPPEGTPLSPEDHDTRWAVEEVHGTICSVLLTIGFQVEETWFEHFSQPDAESTNSRGLLKKATRARFERLASEWNDGIQQLMAWLGWEDQFTGCTEVCAWDERCYIPMWPLMGFGGGGGGRPRRPPGMNGTYPFPYGGPPRGPYGGRPPGGPGGPGGGGSRGHNPWMMGDETELWEPRCAKTSHFMGS